MSPPAITVLLAFPKHRLLAPPAEIDRPNTMAVWTFTVAKRSLGRVGKRGIGALSKCDDPQPWRAGMRRALGKARRDLFGRHF